MDLGNDKCKKVFEFLGCGLGAKGFVSISFMTQSGLVEVALRFNGQHDAETLAHRHV